jgi:hypothetical protein
MTLREIRSAHPTYRGVAGAARLAKALGGRCSAPTIRRWECGEPIPEHAEARLLDALGIAPADRQAVRMATRRQVALRGLTGAPRTVARTSFPVERGRRLGAVGGPPSGRQGARP